MRFLLPVSGSLAKAHVKGHFRNGVWVEPYDTKTPAAKPDLSGPFKGEEGGPKHPGNFAAPKWGWGSHKAPEKPKPAPKAWHPQMNDSGDDVPIYRPHKPSEAATWRHPDEIATVCPGGPVPASLNGIALKPWEDAPTDHEGWASVAGQAEIDEPELPDLPKGKKLGAGVIVQEPDGRVWVIHPTNAFGGYKASFPKGTAEEGLSLQANAIKEAFEESGLQVEITGHLMDVERTTSVARFYTARRVGGSPSDCGWESQAVSLVPVAKLYDVLNHSSDHGLAERLGAGKPPLQLKPEWAKKPKPPGPSGQGSLL